MCYIASFFKLTHLLMRVLNLVMIFIGSFPGRLWRRKGLVHTVCACPVTPRILRVCILPYITSSFCSAWTFNCAFICSVLKISTAEADHGFEAALSIALVAPHIFQYRIWLDPCVESVYWMFYWCANGVYQALSPPQRAWRRGYDIHSQ